MTDLLEIPGWLKVGTPENDRVRREGAARVAATPRPRPKAKPKRIAPTKTQKKRSTKSTHDQIRQRLVDVDFSPAFVAELSITQAKQLTADLVAGKGCAGWVTKTKTGE